MASSETKFCIYDHLCHLSSRYDMILFVCFISQLLCFFVVFLIQNNSTLLLHEKQISQPRLNWAPCCFRGHNVWATQRKNESKLDEVPVKQPLLFVTFLCFPGHFLLIQKGEVQIVTAWQRADGVSQA